VTVRFAFTEDQELWRQTMRAALARLCPPSAVRAAWSGARPRERWLELARLGLLGGLDAVELTIALEEAGRVALPEPLVEAAAVAVPLLAGGALAQQVASGAAIVTAGLLGAPFVVDADVADLLLLEDEAGVHALARAAVELEPALSVDGARRLFKVRWRAADGELLGPAGDAAERGALGAAAQLIGLARRMLEVTVAHVQVRRQFGRPVGSFQAVKHHLADALGRVELAAPVVTRAAAALAGGEPARALRVSMAKACASDAAGFVARTALQCHGAIGYAFENDLHMWMKRTWALAAAWGDAAWHRRRVAEAVLDQGAWLEMGE
jgi:alkylation response protein AidB-like acyl-CoA dehydrogenase